MTSKKKAKEIEFWRSDFVGRLDKFSAFISSSQGQKDKLFSPNATLANAIEYALYQKPIEILKEEPPQANEELLSIDKITARVKAQVSFLRFYDIAQGWAPRKLNLVEFYSTLVNILSGIK